MAYTTRMPLLARRGGDAILQASRFMADLGPSAPAVILGSAWRQVFKRSYAGLMDGGFAWAAFAGEGVGGTAGWNWEAAPSGRRGNGRRKRAASGERAELAGGERVECAEAISEFGGGEALLAVEAAEEIARRPFALLRVALDAARDEVAVRIAAETHARHNMIETLLRRGKPAQTVKTEAALAGVDGLAKHASLQEVGILERHSLGVQRSGGAVDAHGVATVPGLGGNRAAGDSGANLVRQADLDEMSGLGTFD